MIKNDRKVDLQKSLSNLKYLPLINSNLVSKKFKRLITKNLLVI